MADNNKNLKSKSTDLVETIEKMKNLSDLLKKQIIRDFDIPRCLSLAYSKTSDERNHPCFVLINNYLRAKRAPTLDLFAQKHGDGSSSKEYDGEIHYAPDFKFVTSNSSDYVWTNIDKMPHHLDIFQFREQRISSDESIGFYEKIIDNSIAKELSDQVDKIFDTFDITDVSYMDLPDPSDYPGAIDSHSDYDFKTFISWDGTPNLDWNGFHYEYALIENFFEQQKKLLPILRSFSAQKLVNPFDNIESDLILGFKSNKIEFDNSLNSLIDKLGNLETMDELDIKNEFIDNTLDKNIIESLVRHYKDINKILSIYTRVRSSYIDFFKSIQIKKAEKLFLQFSENISGYIKNYEPEGNCIGMHEGDYPYSLEPYDADEDFLVIKKDIHDALLINYRDYIHNRLDMIIKDYEVVEKNLTIICDALSKMKLLFQKVISEIQTKEFRSEQTGERRLNNVLKAYEGLIRLKTDRSYYSVPNETFDKWISEITKVHQKLLTLCNEDGVESHVDITVSTKMTKNQTLDEYIKAVQAAGIKDKNDYEEKRNSGNFNWIISRPDLKFKKDWPKMNGWKNMFGQKNQPTPDEWKNMAIKHILEKHKIGRNDIYVTSDNDEYELGSWWYRQKEKDDEITREITILLDEHKEVEHV